MSEERVLNISKKSFFSVMKILGLLIGCAILLTYIIPRGMFIYNLDGTLDFDNFTYLDHVGGINIFKGIFAPILVLTTEDALSLTMLSIFIIMVSGSFQVMSDTNGIKVIVERLIKKFENHRHILVMLITLVFMAFGAFFGLFEETLALLPVIIVLSLSLGYDSYTGFLMCTVATGFGFATAITNPFTIVYASNIIDASINSGLLYRLLIFVVMYFILISFISTHARKIKKHPELSVTYHSDNIKRKNLNINIDDVENSKKIFKIYIIFLAFVFVSIMLSTSLPALRDYTVAVLITVFLIGGIISGYLASKDWSLVWNGFKKGFVSTLPAILMILMASSIKYILSEGMILDTITHSLQIWLDGKSVYLSIVILLGIILVLEFFISSSTAKAIVVMGVLNVLIVNGGLGISKELVILAYVFGDGYSNVLFPTSPVLLIALSLTGISYSKWLKKAIPLYVLVTLLMILFLFIGYWIGY